SVHVHTLSPSPPRARTPTLFPYTTLFRSGAEKFGTRAEVKNLNSFRFVEKAINYEAARQIDILESGGKVAQETRLYDPDKGETRDRKSTRLNSSHQIISYAVFCLKKKKEH